MAAHVPEGRRARVWVPCGVRVCKTQMLTALFVLCVCMGVELYGLGVKRKHCVCGLQARVCASLLRRYLSNNNLTSLPTGLLDQTRALQIL